MVLFGFVELLKGHIYVLCFALSYVPNVDCSPGGSTAVLLMSGTL